MDFQLYFLKEGTRVYEKADLITLLSATPNITAPEMNNKTGKYVFTYRHTVLDFEAKIIISDKSVVPHLERLNSRFYDVNVYVEFDVLSPNYAVEILLDIVQEIASKFDFKIYVESFVYDVKPFRRAEIIKNFNSWKRAYADKHPEELSKYCKLDSQAISLVYGYLQKKKRLEITFDTSKVQISDYVFLHTEKSRSAFVAIKWDGEKQFILPPAVDLMILDDGKVNRYISMSEIMMKAEKVFKPIDGYGSIQIVDAKCIKKLHKLLVKERFSPPYVELKQLPLENIKDI
ncbi:MAG: hypothetical protein IKP77_02805 [Acholeplasmatales bacterium]|nr:hypothetical protein [Acholeplasmatales bacterium]